jgi:3D-(3,5/4)-trihydroxycyclohexane-1,2-dione acylhydrolase (decyclizing)
VYRDPSTGRLDGSHLPVDLAANAESLGATVLRALTIPELTEALATARAHEGGPIVVHVETDPLLGGPDGGAWWDVPVAQHSVPGVTQRARRDYEGHKASQRPYL